MRELAVVSRERVDVDSYLSGQEYYLYSLARVLAESGLKVRFLTLDEAIDEDYEIFHLYYLGSRDVAALRRRHRGSKLVYHVYHVEDITWSKLHTFSWKTFLVSIQMLVDMYLSSSRSVYQWIRLRTPFSKHVLVEPFYECSCRSFEKLKSIVESKFINADEFRLLYIGRINPYRLPLDVVIDLIKKLSMKMPTRLTIVSKIGERQQVKKLRIGDSLIEIINRRISDKEKCFLYRNHYFFLYLARGNVAMNPPITLLEAAYHGCIPITSSVVVNDLDIPRDLIANNVEEIYNTIVKLFKDVERVVKLTKELRKRFERFYDVHRFLKAIRQAI